VLIVYPIECFVKNVVLIDVSMVSGRNRIAHWGCEIPWMALPIGWRRPGK